MADIRSILKELNKPDLLADECTKSFIQRYPGAKLRWKTKDGHQFLEQIEYMAVYVEQFSAQLKMLKDKVAVRVIDTFRKKNDRASMLDSIKDKTPPKDTVDAGPTYNGPNPWAKLMLDAEEISYDNRAEDFYLTVINDSEVNTLIKNQLTNLMEGDFTLQSLCTQIATVMRKEGLTMASWRDLKPVQRAYALRGILNHFVPELSEGAITIRTMIVWAIKAEPKLKGFIPLGCGATIFQDLTTPTPTPIPTMNSELAVHVPHYADTPIAKPTLIYGNDISVMDDEELIDATKEIQDRIDKLKAIPGNSRKIAKQIKTAEEAMTLVVAMLDDDLPEEKI